MGSIFDDFDEEAIRADQAKRMAAPAETAAAGTGPSLDKTKKEKAKAALKGIGKMKGVTEAFKDRPKVFLQAGEYKPYEFE